MAQGLLSAQTEQDHSSVTWGAFENVRLRHAPSSVVHERRGTSAACSFVSTQWPHCDPKRDEWRSRWISSKHIELKTSRNGGVLVSNRTNQAGHCRWRR